MTTTPIGDTSQWPKSRKRSAASMKHLRLFWAMLPYTRLLCRAHGMQNVVTWAEKRFVLACGCKRGNKL